MLRAGKLSDSTAKLLEDMAKRSGLALKQINEVSAAVEVVVVVESGANGFAKRLTLSQIRSTDKQITQRFRTVKTSVVVRLPSSV